MRKVLSLGFVVLALATFVGLAPERPIAAQPPPVVAGYIVHWGAPPEGLCVTETTVYAEGVWSISGAGEPPTRVMLHVFIYDEANEFVTALAEEGSFDVTYADDESGTYSGTWSAQRGHNAPSGYLAKVFVEVSNYNNMTLTETLIGESSMQSQFIP